uniref:DNA methyltransferase 1-associated protein 1 n=1 Tax=Cacopsylla melanoneura TaxID=428564 RepID=A0A8D9EGX8_9HEMI
MTSDIRDILELEKDAPAEITREAIIGVDKTRKMQPNKYKKEKRPEGMAREVFALLCNDNRDAPPLLPTDSGQGYKHVKAKLGMRKVRQWKWLPFSNPARKDNAVFHHWRRVTDEGKEYPFARFNKQVSIPTYTDTEYLQELQSPTWTRAETDHLFDLCHRFDLRFIVIHDRYDTNKFPTGRSIEDLKQRYYFVCHTLAKMRGTESSAGSEPKLFDAEHEKKRKEQLKRLFERTPEQVDEEQMLLAELKKIEIRRKERDRKTQDLQKLMTAADLNTDNRKQEKKMPPKRKLAHQIPRRSLDTTVSRPDHRQQETGEETGAPDTAQEPGHDANPGVSRYQMARDASYRSVHPVTENETAYRTRTEENQGTRTNAARLEYKFESSSYRRDRHPIQRLAQ